MKRLTILCALFCLLSITTYAQQVTVNAADYSTNLAPGGLASAFGAELAATTESAASLPLPTTLAGTRVLVNGKAAPLLFASPSQINYQLPEDTPTGDIEVIVERSNGNRTRETINVKKAGFAAFSFDSTGTGTGAILDGRTFRQGPYEIQNSRGEATILALFGTGLGEVASRNFVSSRVRVFVGGIEAKVHYAGPQPDYAGLDQINFELPSNVANYGTLPVVVRVDEQPANSVTVDVVATETASLSIAVEESFTSSGQIAVLRVSPFPDIDTLKVTLRAVNLVSDSGVEVAVISAPLTVDLLSPDAAAKLIKRLSIKPGTYVALAAEIAEVMASYKGQAVPMALANKTVQHKLREPLKLEKETTIGVSFAFDVRASVKKLDNGGYSFNPVMLLSAISPHVPAPAIQKFEGKITSIDAATKQLKVLKGAGSQASTIVVEAKNARVLTREGRLADFAALKVDDKVEVTGALNSRGVVEAVLIVIGGALVPPPRPVAVTGTINSINLTGKSLELAVEALTGVQTLVPVRKMTIKWDEKTRFADELRGTITPDKLLVGQRLSAQLAAFAEPSLATSILVLHPHVRGTVIDTKGLPNSFVVSPYVNSAVLISARQSIINLTATTKIKSVLGEDLKPSDITVGSQVEAVGDMPSGSNTMTAEYIIVLGMEVKGTTSTTEVDVQRKTFVVTAGNGAKVKVSMSDRTVIAISPPANGPITILPITLVKPDEFIKLLANKPYTVSVVGLKDSSGIMQAQTIRAEERK